jgi:hypothetical protein
MSWANLKAARRYRFLNEQKAPELSRTGPSTGEVWVAPPHRCTWLRRSELGCRISSCHLPALGSPSTIPGIGRPSSSGRNLAAEGLVARPACDPANQGVRPSPIMDHDVANQKARVYVNNAQVGTWYTAE